MPFERASSCENLLPVSAVMERLSVSEDEVYALARRREIRMVDVSGRGHGDWRVIESTVDVYVESLANPMFA